MPNDTQQPVMQSATQAIRIYALTQVLQWFSYTAIFAILLDGHANRNFLAPLYIALLAFFRGIGSLGWIYRQVLGKPWLIALVTARTIVISASKKNDMQRKFNVSLHFNAIRWLGIASGGTLLALLLRSIDFYPLAFAFLFGMAISGLLFWLDAIMTTNKE